MSWQDWVYREALHDYDPDPDDDRPSKAEVQEDDEEIRTFRRRWHARQAERYEPFHDLPDGETPGRGCDDAGQAHIGQVDSPASARNSGVA